MSEDFAGGTAEEHRDQVACPRSLKPPGEGLRTAPQCDCQHRDLCFFPLLEDSPGQEEGADFNISAFNYSVSLPRLVTEPLSLNTFFLKQGDRFCKYVLEKTTFLCEQE